jgi:hypothetical protein
MQAARNSSIYCFTPFTVLGQKYDITQCWLNDFSYKTAFLFAPDKSFLQIGDDSNNLDADGYPKYVEPLKYMRK